MIRSQQEHPSLVKRLWEMVGAESFEPVPPEKIDDIVYVDRRS